MCFSDLIKVSQKRWSGNPEETNEEAICDTLMNNKTLEELWLGCKSYLFSRVKTDLPKSPSVPQQFLWQLPRVWRLLC